MWTTFNVFIEFVTILLLFYVLVFWPRGMRDLSSPTRVKTRTPALEGEVLTTGRPGKSLKLFLFFKFIYLFVCLRLCWVFVAAYGLSLVAVSGGYSSFQ